MISPASTASSDVHTSADAEPTNTERRLTLPDAIDGAASCVLSPSSATNTAPNVVASSFQSMPKAKHEKRPGAATTLEVATPDHPHCLVERELLRGRLGRLLRRAFGLLDLLRLLDLLGRLR